MHLKVKTQSDRILFIHPINDFTGSTRVLASVIEKDFENSEKYLLTIDVVDGLLSNLNGVNKYKIFFPLWHKQVIPFVTSFLSFIDRVFMMIYLCTKVDCVYINTIKPYYAAIIAKLFKKKIIWHVHEKYQKKSFDILIMEYVLSHIDARFIFVSNYLKEQYRISVKSKCEVKYNKLDYSFLSKIRVCPINNRSKSRITMICSFSAAKGIYTFVETSKLLPQFDFTLVMSTSEYNVNKFVLETNAPKNCQVLPKQTNVHPIYASSDLVLNLTKPSLCVETFGMTIIEAFAYGLPVIVPCVGGPAEIVNDRYNGRLVNVDDVSEIKKAVIDIFGNYSNYANNAIATSKFYI